ncbi:histidine phosphatase family protein [Clostridium sp. BJN0001]|uniref:histidine phosphatase family protein n=1 Tax=Clostridium sp. BJN0001 TaxID=2930219 RepID=UPI001FD2359E|nr:histidine phosphatase family protein [Clostridium sp. BJN0001]
MRIGIVRHFKVNCNKRFFMTPDDLKLWEDTYNKSTVTRNDVNLQKIKWDKCYCSTLSRAIKTAQDIFKGEIIRTPLICETVIDPVYKHKIRIPYHFHSVLSRASWYLNGKSQTETKATTKKKANEFIDILLENNKKDHLDNILVVTHGFFMFTLQRELKKRGFKGKITIAPKNGTLYLYQN